MIKIEIHGDCATEALNELKVIARALTGTAVVVSTPTLVKSPTLPEVVSEPTETFAQPEPASEDQEIDAHGHVWNEELHASTKTQTKEGLWRMKPGATRPDPMPGFPKDETPSETSAPSPEAEIADTVTEPAGSTLIEEPASADASQDEDDEFAAFRAAAAKAEEAQEEAKANVPARKFTDADLGAVCNQAAVKLGDPSPIKELIAKFTLEGEVAHSRNVPTDKRAEFVTEIEKVAGIEFAG